MSYQSQPVSTPGAVGGIERFNTVEDLFLAMEADRANPYRQAGIEFFRPLELIADGTGLRCEYVPSFGEGIAELYRPFPGVLIVLFSGAFKSDDDQATSLSGTGQGGEQYCIRLFEEGGLRLGFGSSVQELGKGSCLVARYPETAYANFWPRSPEKHQFAHIMFNHENIQRISQRLGVPAPPAFATLANARNAEDFAIAYESSTDLHWFTKSLWPSSISESMRAVYYRMKIGELFCLLCSQGGDSNQQTNLTFFEIRRLNQVREILDASFRHPPTISKLASESGLNRRKLTEGFRKLFGITIAGYTKERRLKFAYQLLSETDEPITDIAEQCGYEHVSNFSRAFKVFFDCNPIDIRNR